MNKRVRGFILVTLAISLGAWLTAQSTTMPGVQGWYIAGLKWVRIQVDKNGVVQVAATITPSGTQNIQGASAVGAAGSQPVTTGYLDDSGNVLADYGFPDEAAVTISAGTDTVMVSGVASTKTYVGHVSFSLNSAQTVTIQQGTGTTCLTNTLVLYGPSPSVSSLALDFDSKGGLHTTIAARDLCLHLGGSATAGGGIFYGTH